MTVSGTLSSAIPTLRHMYDQSFRRAGIPAQMITSEHLEIAKGLLNEVLSDLAADGCTLWTNDSILVGMQQGVPKVAMPLGTIEVERVIVRSLSPITGTVTGTTPNWTLTATEAVEAQYVGVKVSTAGIYDLAVDSSLDGVTWVEEETYEYRDLVVGKWNWLEVTPDTASSAYFRVRETDAAAFPVTDLCVATEEGERPLHAMSADDYSNMPNKRQQGTVNSYWTDRQVDQPVLNLWSCPDEDHEDKVLVVWRTRHVKDVGDMTDRAEIPQRWVGSLSWELAWRLSAEIPEAKKKPQEIRPFADIAKARLAPTETDGSSMSMTPDISVYTR